MNWRTGQIHLFERAGRSGRKGNDVYDRLLKEKEEREMAMLEADLTARLMGDPPPGYSALDKSCRSKP